MTETCDLPPFISQVVAQKGDLESAASAMELFIRQLENWLSEFKTAVCNDLQSGGGGATAFLQLTDTPSTYVGAARQVVRVNALQTALEFITQTFLLLGDTPSSYASQGGNIVRVNGGETALEFTSPTGLVAGNALTPLLQLMWAPFVNTPFIQTFGVSAGAIEAGAGSFQLAASGSILSSRTRARYTSNAPAGSSAVIRNAGNLAIQLGNAAGEGGFRFRARFGTETAVANQRLFIGLTATIAFGNVTVTSRVNLIGFGYNSGDANLSFVHNDGAGNAVLVPLGASFPVDATSLYDVTITALPNAASVSYTITNVGTGATASGSVAADLPAGNQGLTPYYWCNNGATAAAVQAALVFLALENYA